MIMMEMMGGRLWAFFATLPLGACVPRSWFGVCGNCRYSSWGWRELVKLEL